MSLTAQEVFDRVAVHLLQQGEPAKLGDPNALTCAYRGQDGKRCAVGCLIPDDAYVERMEGHSVTQLLSNFAPILPQYFREHLSLLRELQSIHDATPTAFWRRSLENVARIFDLNTAALPPQS